MASKLKFTDILGGLAPQKLYFGLSVTNAVSITGGTPAQGAIVGALAVDSVNGAVYRKYDNSSTSWENVTSITNGFFGVQQTQIQINSAVTATDGTGPVIGDLVGLFGAGAWSTSGNLNVSRYLHSGCGSQNAALVAGGLNAGVAAITTTELFNGSSWALGVNLNVSRFRVSGCGSQNAALVACGLNGNSQAVTSTELFNGSSWVAGGNLNVSRDYNSACGSQNAALIAGGFNSGSAAITTTELFNGSSWTFGGNLNVSRDTHSGCGSQNAGLVAGGLNAGVGITTTELFNGSSWVLSGNLNISRYYVSGCGSQNAALIAGGLNSGSAAITTTELFNGSTWSLSGNLNVSREQASGCGSQNAGLVAGGLPAGVSQSTSEIHNQTTWRKLTPTAYYTSIATGILSSAGTVTLQGTANGPVYPANYYLVLNRSLNNMVTNNTLLNSVAIASVLGSGSNWTYNFTTTPNVLSVEPGMIVIATASGATPFVAANAGTFIINSVVSPTSIGVINAAGVSNNPGTGTLQIITSMKASLNPTPQDIVVGFVDGSGTLTLYRQPELGFWGALHK